MDWEVIVVGAGAAGLVAAERAAARGRRTLLLEKNPRPGVKILMSGGTRCNLTQATDPRGIVAAFGDSGQFLHSALAQLSPQDLVALVENEGVPTKVEPTGKIFPVSNRATDILAALVARLNRSGCTLAPLSPVTEIARHEAGFRVVTPKSSITTKKLIVTTGGKSYPGCGTSGDAYAWAERLGHAVNPPRPALTPVTSAAAWLQALQGVTIADVALRLFEPGTQGQSIVLDRRRGSMLFTHFGISGPVALDLSRSVTAHSNPNSLSLQIDFLPGMSEQVLAERFRTAATESGRKQISALVGTLLPQRLADALLTEADIPRETKIAEASKAIRARLVEAIKRTEIPISGTRGFDKAEVTAGGVPLDEVDSSTMQSRLLPNLYWAGEILDLDGPIGGYNFQAAFSTGWLAGLKV